MLSDINIPMRTNNLISRKPTIPRSQPPPARLCSSTRTVGSRHTQRGYRRIYTHCWTSYSCIARATEGSSREPSWQKRVPETAAAVDRSTRNGVCFWLVLSCPPVLRHVVTAFSSTIHWWRMDDDHLEDNTTVRGGLSGVRAEANDKSKTGRWHRSLAVQCLVLLVSRLVVPHV
ncbi:uncharacterized protein B0I36DRAFT_126862 [Microdochium trichocladiopsis]|uniref:Uncharacterized protein n=1 Tax=Microdochium trichocladiopsis TaxID=1682393 RepID=A0A9P8Y5N2_9PEZI|nr:uncharacterized protein B0I36DRAFT_126862 [Microdochium trichocladiopsis]KAH7028888.1 hypothetical protein B0I36DRAFT_126862 [Microdochium trichocladiopsis]